MSIWESIRVAVNMLRLHKLRAFLTMLGVIIGVMSVTLIVMISEGFQYFMTSEIKSVGADTVMIMFDPGRMRRGESLGSLEGLTTDDVTLIRNRVPEVSTVSAILQVPAQKIIFADKEVSNPRIYACDEYQRELDSAKVQEGRLLEPTDIFNRTNVCVIGEEIRDRLFSDKQSIGKYVNFEGITLEVVGVLERKDTLGETNARDVYVPISTAQDKWVGGDSVTYIQAKPKEGIGTQPAMDSVWRVLMEKSGNKPVYRVDSNESILGVFNTILGAAGAILAAIAALSLLVGGIGIMNIMLVSVTERTREIGLRKAVGARRATVLTQFLVESALLSLVGGAIGMVIAFIFGKGVTALTAMVKWPSEAGLPTVFPMASALMALAFSAFIGVVFGLYPAARASQLSPIEALRSE